MPCASNEASCSLVVPHSRGLRITLMAAGSVHGHPALRRLHMFKKTYSAAAHLLQVDGLIPLLAAGGNITFSLHSNTCCAAALWGNSLSEDLDFGWGARLLHHTAPRNPTGTHAIAMWQFHRFQVPTRPLTPQLNTHLELPPCSACNSNAPRGESQR